MYCRYCGTHISENSQFCSHCGKRQTPSENFFKSLRAIISNINRNKKEKQDVVEVPEGYCFCSYCGEVYQKENFQISLDEEFHICKKCKKRRSMLSPVSISFIVLLIEAIILLIGGWEDGIYVIFISIFTGLFLLLGAIISFLLGIILDSTSLRIELSSKREKWLRKCVKPNGEPLITPIIRTYEEEVYRRKTGVYLSRDIIPGYFKCPCCDKQYPIASCPIIDETDSRISYTSSWLGGSKMKTTRTSYKVSICPDCYKYMKVVKYLLYIPAVIGTIIAPILYCTINGTTTGAIIGFIFIGFFVGSFVGWLLGFVYKLYVTHILRRNLFVYFGTAARNGAVRPLQ